MRKELKKLNTAVIRTMITAYSSYCGPVLTDSEKDDNKIKIRQLLEEIASRHELILPIQKE